MHCCASPVPFDLLEKVGAPGLGVDLALLTAEGYDGVAAALEADRRVFLGVVPTTAPATVPTTGAVVEQVERFLDLLGLGPTDRLVLTPACGLAGADGGWDRRALELCRTAAAALTG